MHHYIDIHLRQDPEFSAPQLLDALFAKLHRVLVLARSSTIAVGFPGYSETPRTLGGTLRLLGEQGDLARLMEHGWLQGMRDHVSVMDMAHVPMNAAHRTLRRVQAKSGVERLRRRQMRRHGLTREEAQERLPDTCAEILQLPSLHLRSTSTGQQFPLFLRLGPAAGSPTAGQFNSYGLSAEATIPWF